MPMPKKDDPPKSCEACGQAMLRKRLSSGTLENRGAFLRRKYCDRECMAAGMMQEEVTLAGLRARAVKFRGTSCETCQTTEQLQIHHIDGDPANNDPQNLMTLCRSCHTRWHWEHGKKARPKSERYCVICGLPARKREWCQKHYQRFRKYGDPCLTKVSRGSHYELIRETPG